MGLIKVQIFVDMKDGGKERQGNYGYIQMSGYEIEPQIKARYGAE